MEQIAFKRVFKNNTKYAEAKLPYMDALALTVQKYFYTKKDICYLGGIMNLYDFMSLTWYYIVASTSEFGQSEIERYISVMDDPYAQMFGGNAVKYTNDKECIIFNGNPKNILSLIWAAWIYARMRFDIVDGNMKQMWQSAAEQLYVSMKDYYDIPENKCFGESNKLLSIADDAMITMGTYMAEKIKKGKNTLYKMPTQNNATSQKKNDSKDVDVARLNQIKELEDRIKELEAEVERLKAENEQLKEVSHNQDTNKRLEDKIDSLVNVIEDILVEGLKPAFYNTEEDVRRFLKEIDGLNAEEIANVAGQYLKDRKIVPSKCKRDIWKFLYAAQIYDKVEQNWSAAMRKYV